MFSQVTQDPKAVPLKATLLEAVGVELGVGVSPGPSWSCAQGLTVDILHHPAFSPKVDEQEAQVSSILVSPYFFIPWR